jgi:hypothetical protein
MYIDIYFLSVYIHIYIYICIYVYIYIYTISIHQPPATESGCPAVVLAAACACRQIGGLVLS